MNTIDMSYVSRVLVGNCRKISFSIRPHNKSMLNMALAMTLAVLGGCTFAPRPELAPVEDHSAKVPPRVNQPGLTREESIPVAKTTPLPTIIEDVPLRAEPLAPWSSTELSSKPPPVAPSQAPTPTVASPIPVSKVPPTVQQAEIQAPPAQKPAASSSNTGVVALLGKADDQAAAGQLASAAVTLERALRIEPENGRLWHELAGIRLKQGQLDAAISMAEKSNSLARNQRNLQSRNWRLIAVAQQKKGKSQAAAEALLRARSMEGSP